jgi:hypothetical protein
MVSTIAEIVTRILHASINGTMLVRLGENKNEPSRREFRHSWGRRGTTASQLVKGIFIYIKHLTSTLQLAISSALSKSAHLLPIRTIMGRMVDPQGVRDSR